MPTGTDRTWDQRFPTLARNLLVSWHLAAEHGLKKKRKRVSSLPGLGVLELPRLSLTFPMNIGLFLGLHVNTYADADPTVPIPHGSNLPISKIRDFFLVSSIEPGLKWTWQGLLQVQLPRNQELKKYWTVSIAQNALQRQDRKKYMKVRRDTEM
ncbi:predicted protein [Sclerotinia sclerotiorum 1980 UF-70]|uniref:Uncharacterized protein n=1 Tax=Sclerotinia sclerotiorum (strain ATCC 18683 / 1980 / Ss-1) TaxID=665079 RepID=A7F755_SCLS1|nr:predicted protein [Sclerotinia sclerotiorum 1980 UF-70]EDN98576.1 predicted protein [Sclerotinia sclerotiorum 1980 UF-70]